MVAMTTILINCEICYPHSLLVHHYLFTLTGRIPVKEIEFKKCSNQNGGVPIPQFNRLGKKVDLKISTKNGNKSSCIVKHMHFKKCLNSAY